MSQTTTPKNEKARRLASIGAQGKVAQKVDLSSPKERAVVDVLALAMAADGNVAVEEVALVVENLRTMLGLEADDASFARQVRDHVSATVAELQQAGRQAILARSVARLETQQERELLFALAAAVTCVDGVMEPAEADYLVALRSSLGLSESVAVAGIAGVAGKMAGMLRRA